MTKLNKTQLAIVENGCAMLTELQEEMSKIAERAQDYADERSEAWHDSEKGAAYQEWLDTLQDAADILNDALDAMENVSEAPDAV